MKPVPAAARSLTVVAAFLTAVAMPVGMLYWGTSPARAGDVVADAQTHDEDRVLPAGTTLVYDGWEIRVAPPKWGQNDAVFDATLHPNMALPGDAHEWVTAEVEVRNVGEVGRSLSSITVSMNGSGHRSHYSLGPRQTMPGQLDESALMPGESRTGNIGWLEQKSKRNAPCTYRVDFLGIKAGTDDARSYQLMCGGPAVESESTR